MATREAIFETAGGGVVTELIFKGKEFVYNHHLAVPFRPLVPQEDKGIGPAALDGNMVHHGDNLHALNRYDPGALVRHRLRL